jgi:hypothetical protein
MGALPGLRCVCTGNPPITTDYCGDGIWATSTEACEGNDAHCGAPWFECDMDRIADGDTDDDICVCDRKPYYGEFQPPFTAFTDEIHTFNVVFADNSTLTPVTWVFAKDRTSGDCVNTINFPTRTMTQAYKTNFNLGPLALQARRGSYCAVTLTARAPDSTYAPPGTYSVDTRTLTAICPDCNVTEIPAILHPIGMYSTGLWDAQREYGSASIAVSSLISKCASSCSATAKMRMEQAKTNRAAAQLYYETCVDGDITCRLSQYYSRTAKQYAVEGMNLP